MRCHLITGRGKREGDVPTQLQMRRIKSEKTINLESFIFNSKLNLLIFFPVSSLKSLI